MATADSSELISVIMPAYNAEKTLAVAVESVLAQTHQNLELLIINDCSKDNTASLARQYTQADHRVKVLENTVNSGVSQTRHKGVESACGKWIAFLDSDDAWKVDKLEKQINAQRATGARLVFTGSAFMNVNGDPLPWTLNVPSEIDYRNLLKQNLISNSSVLILKESYQKYETIGDNMHEDFVCWLKFLRAGNLAVGIDEPLLVYRLSAASKSGNKLRAVRMNWNAYRVIGLNVWEACYFMAWYAIRGLLKYRHLRR